MKLLIRPNNREVLRKIAERMSDSSLTSALNFVLEKAGQTVLEQLGDMQVKGRSGASTQRTSAAPPKPAIERRAYIPELDIDTVESAFD